MNTKLLRQTILDRAIRGLLVPQDPTDEPASVLLERIRAEKEQLIKDKKLKREKRESQPIEEVPFEIPEGWVWCRLGEIGIWGSGVTPNRNNKEYYDGNIPWLKTGDLNDSYIYGTSELITDLAVKDCSLKKIPIGSVLIAMYGATIAKLGLLEIEVTTNQACCACTPFSGIVNKFLFHYLFSQKQNIKDKAEGGAQPNISKEKLINFIFPLPPLAEQHRIVQKIEQLFALVDIIEVNKKALEKLIEQAKSQVLSDAIAGKLTHQDPNDEPAEELLKRMGKTTAPDTPYEKMLPKGWAWCRLGEVCSFENGYAFNSNDYQKKGIPLIRISNIKNREIDISKAVYIEAEYDKRFIIEYGDLLIAMSGATTGKMGVYKLDRKALLNQRVGNIKVKNKDICFSEFRDYFMQTKSNEILKMAYGGAQPNISGKMIENLTFSLPPFAEQHRIVQKIESYFSFFDMIENNL